MRLKHLSLRNYGCFADLELEFRTEPGRITLITAPNGSGKSVIRQAFHDLLFDIPKRSPMMFRHGYPGMRLHADAVEADGVPFSFGWERNARPERTTSDPARFARLREGITPQQLEGMFALDTERLRRGGTDLKGGSTLSEALLAGTGELASAKAVRALIDERRDRNWGKRKSTPPLNAAANHLDQVRKRLRGLVERPEVREREERALADRRDELERIRAERRQAVEETHRLNRIALTRPHLQALDEAQRWLDQNTEAPALPGGLAQELADARAAVVLAQTHCTALIAAQAEASARLDAIVRDPACTRLAGRLKGLPGQLGSTEKAAGDLGKLRVEHANSMAAVRASLQAIGSRLPESRANELIPTVALKAEIRTAISQEAELRATLKLARDGVGKAQADLTRAEAEPSPSEPLSEGLVALLAEIRLDRNPSTHAEEVAAARAEAASEVRRTLALVPSWNGTAEELRSLALPSEQEFERRDATRQLAATQAGTARADVIRLTGEEREARAALTRLHERALPDTASVNAARARRDEGMRLVLARAYGTPPAQADENVYAGVEPMPLAYERRVRDADRLADERAEEMERVQEAEQLNRLIGSLAEPLLRAASDLEQAEEAVGRATDAWLAAVGQIGFGSDGTIGELRSFLDGRVAAVDALAGLEKAADAEAALGRKHGGWAERLAACIGVPAGPLGSLLAHADERVAAAGRTEKAAIKRQATLETARQALPKALAAQDEAERAMTQWQDAWSELLERFGRPSDESSSAVGAVLDEITKLERHHHDGHSLMKRIEGIQADLDSFSATLLDIARELGQPEPTAGAELARAVIARAAAASEAEVTWQQAREALDGATNAVTKAETAFGQAQARLAAVVASCGAEDAEAAETRIAASRAHAEHVARRDEARSRLLEHGDGLSFEELRREAGAVPVDDMLSRRQAATDAASSAQSRAEEASVALDKLQRTLDAAASSTDALTAQADYEAAVKSFDRLLEQQVVLHVASTMLGEAMREVEESAGGSALARISDTFSAVTDGAYGLKVHDSPSGEELYALELAYPNEKKELMELSEGTRDQLYLALRMEALKGHCRSAMAVPFIADDVLQTFDDQRAVATLQAFCELSNDVQVIVLTHHPHLQQLAATLDGGNVDVIRLAD